MCRTAADRGCAEAGSDLPGAGRDCGGAGSAADGHHDVAAGRRFTQAEAERLAGLEHLVLLCGRYEGFDERVRERVTEELSIGDYVLTGGELPALVVLDAVARFVPGVVGDEQSVAQDTFSRGLLNHPQYTRPVEIEVRGVHGALEVLRVPEGTDVREPCGDSALAETRGAEPDPGAAAGPTGRGELGRRRRAVAARA